jgi:hypothetical protein
MQSNVLADQHKLTLSNRHQAAGMVGGSNHHFM